MERKGNDMEKIKKCSCCDSDADIFLHQMDGVFLCKKCALDIYKSLAVEFVPKAIPNVVLKAERQERNSQKSLNCINTDKNLNKVEDALIIQDESKQKDIKNKKNNLCFKILKLKKSKEN